MNIDPHANQARRLLGDVQVVSGDHLHLDARVDEILHRLRSVVARRVEHGQDAAVVPRLVVDLHHHAQRLVARLGEIRVHRLDGVLKLLDVLHLPLVGSVVLATVLRVRHLVGQALGNGDFAHLGMFVLVDHALVDGVEPHGASLGVLAEDLLAVGAENALEVLGDRSVDGVFLLVRIRGQYAVQSHVLLGEGAAGPHRLCVDGDTRSGEGAGLVRAQNGHRGDVLQSR
mmetsp:Transcript_11331/g.18559  ORF Transcript_11331/g.18559 Transcript_11331/m.18559 type:complete len:229 (-) Transcript_11331:22-708(-)